MRSAQSLPLSATRALSGYRDVTQVVANGARHDRRILADPEYERRLPGAEEVNADEVQPGHGGTGTVRRERKPELVKGRQPDPARIVRAKAGGHDVASFNAPRSPGSPTAGQKDLPACQMQILRDLASRLTAADDQDPAGW